MNDQMIERKKHFLQQGTRALQKRQLQDAVALLEEAHDIAPEDVDVSLNLSGAYILTKKFKKAIPLLEVARQTQPDNPMIWTNLGAAYLGNPVLAQDEDQHNAIAAFERALELDPSAPNVAYNIGLIYRHRREYEHALRWFERAVETNPQDKDARYYIDVLTKIIAGEAQDPTDEPPSSE